MSDPRPHQLFQLLLCVLFLSGCDGTTSTSPDDASHQDNTPVKLSAMATLGKKLFFDPSLSASGMQSCASCHVPGRAHAGDDNLPVPMGGPTMTTQGFRNAPSLNYLQYNPAFYFDNEGTPTGGFNRDGRAASFAAQAEIPILAAHEMANGTPEAFADKLASADYVDDFIKIFGNDIFTKPEQVYHRAALAIGQYEKEDPAFHPFSSKFDYFLQGKVQLSVQELRGFALFNDPQKGNCASCHISTSTIAGVPPLFTDFTYDNLGVPRNMAITANNDASYYDLGLCGPDRKDLAARTELCGAFKVPSLRNVALTAPYFHNGIFTTLQQVVSFYVTRDTHPQQWYPTDSDGVNKFNDLPVAYRSNVNVTEVPYNRHPGDLPALSNEEIEDVVAFLQTLTDGYTPENQE